MPNDLTKRNMLDGRADMRPNARETIENKGFLTRGGGYFIWTLSGVVLAACGSFEDFLGLDDNGGGGGGRSLHVQKSPVQGARLYFDADGDGMISTEEREAQDAQYPQGFISDADGRVSGIPAALYGKAFVADLDGAIDADTGAELAGALHSIAGANGQHTLASPITDYIFGQTGKSTEQAIEDILPDTANGEAEIAAFLEAISNPDNYLDGGLGIEALADYLADPQNNDPSESAVQGQVIDLYVNDGTDTLRIQDTDISVTIGAHDNYVAKIEAVNHARGAVQYRIVEPVDSGAFAVNERGVISVVEGQTPTTTTLRIEVSNGDAGETEIVNVVVTVADAPSLESPTQSATIAENVEAATGGMDLISGITTTATTPTWVIREAVPTGFVSKFDIAVDGANAYKLVLKAGQSLDHEAFLDGVANLLVWAEDASGVRSNALALSVMVTDANDAPVFVVSTPTNGLTDGTEEISENAAIGAEVARVRAADADSSGANSIVRYAITAGNTGNVFDIDNNGIIRVANPLDFESATSYTLEITASDGGDNPPADAMTATMMLTISVTDVNDVIPTYTESGASDASVRIVVAAENTAGASTGYSITITDADATNSFGVSVSGDARDRFEFQDQGAGVWELFLKTGEVVDEPEGAEITLTYTVSDGENDAATPGSVRIAVVDTPVSFTPPTDTDLMADEDDANWRLQLEAESDAGGSGGISPIARYEFVDGSSTSQDSGIFRINDDGLITITSAFDFEDSNPNSYEFTVRATDSRDDPESNEITFTIAVQNLDDGTAQFTISGTIEAGETLMIADTVPDPDGYASINYLWYWEDASVADVNAEDRFKRVLDENRNPHTGDTYTIPANQDLTNVLGYAVVIEYTDNSGFVASVANENAINLYLATTTVHFAAGKGDAPQTISINENDATPANLPTLEATAEGGGAITYAITGGNTGDKFQIGETSGIITLKSGALDYESDATRYTLTITATDSAQGQTGDTNTAIVIVNVDDVNEALTFDAPTYTKEIAETLAIDAEVLRVSATDEDREGANGEVRYDITGGTGAEFFTIDPITGVITVKKELDYDTPTPTTSYTLEITAKDGGDNPPADAMMDTAMVEITLTNVDDEAPTRQEVSVGGSGQIAEIAGSGVAPVGGKDANYRISVTDADTTSGFTFTFTGDTPSERTLAERFDFIKTGNEWALTLKAGEALDRDDRTLFPDSTITLKYTINDGSGNISEEYSVEVLVTDTNDNAPTVTVAEAVAGTNGAVDERIAGNSDAINVTGLMITVTDADIGFDPSMVNVGLDGDDFKIYNAADDSENMDFEVSGFSRTAGVGTWNIRLKAGKALDFEMTPTVSLKIGVDDGTNPVVIPDTAFTINVNNLDEGTATYAVSGSVAEDAELEATLATADLDGVDDTVDVMYRWFRKASTDVAPTSFETAETATFKWLDDEASTDNTHTIDGVPVAGAEYGVLVGYQDNSLDILSFTPALASSLEFGASSYSGSIDEDGENITTIDIDATLGDSADDISYAFVTDASTGATDPTHLGFAIDSDGVIRFTGTASTYLDYDTDPRTERIDLTVRATYDNSNSAIPNPFSDVDVAITVNDLNDNPPTAKPSATTDALAEQSFSTHLPRKTGITFTIEDVDSVGGSTVMASNFVVYAGASGTTTDDRFEVVDLGSTWTLRLKANEELDYEEEISGDNDPSIIVRVAIDDGTHTPIPSDPITITVQNRNDVGTVAITRDTATKTLTATLTDDDGILTPADDPRAINPSYEWFDVATGERVGTDSNTFTYTDDDAHYRVRVEYNDVWSGANLVNRAETSTAPISLSPNFAQLLEHLAVLVVPVTARLSSDNSVIPTNELTLAFVTEDGTTATTYKGVTIANGRVMPASADRLNYEALTPDEQTNGIKFIIRATHDGTSVDIAFNVRVSNQPEVVIFDDGVGDEVDYTDYLKTIKFLDGKTIAATETLHTAAATAESGGGISYALTGTDSSLFEIDSTSGAVTFKAETVLDASTKDSYEFEVIATETGTTNSERQSVTIDVSSIIITSADTGSNTKSFIDGEIAKTAPNVVILKTLTADTTNNAAVTYAITGGADMDLFSVRTTLSQGQGMVTKLELNIRGDFVRKAQYEVEITATNDVTMETDVQMYTHSVPGYPETPPVIKLTLPDSQGAINYVTPLDIDDEDTDIITFTIEDPDPAKTYAAGDISVVDSDDTPDARFTVTWDESTQTGTLQAAGGGVNYGMLDIPHNGKATDPRWTETFIKVTDTPEGSITSGDDVRVVLRVVERSIEITSPSTGHEIRNADLSASGSITAAVINVDVTGASAMVDWAITGGADAALFTLADRANHGTNVKLNLDHADFVKKAEYKVKLTATNTVTTDKDDLELTITVTGFVESAPAITPNRQAQAHDPYDPDTDPLAGMTPIPETDPNG